MQDDKRTILIPESLRKELIQLSEDKSIFLEGNIIKMLDSEGDEDFDEYIKKAIDNDKAQRKKRLEITKDVQRKNSELTEQKEEIEKQNAELTKKQEEIAFQNKELTLKKNEIETQNDQLTEKQKENERLMLELKDALNVAENAKNEAINDLSLMQKKKQFELIGIIVQTALIVIVSVGVITTILYGYAIFYSSKETTLIGNTWSNLFGILLTNSFSIIGTIMGVKYATDSKEN